MRLVLKLLCACGLATLVQCAVTPPAAAWADAELIWFGIRVSMATAGGTPSNAPKLLDEAERLLVSENKRFHEERRLRGRVAADPQPTPAASAACEPEECR